MSTKYLEIISKYQDTIIKASKFVYRRYRPFHMDLLSRKIKLWGSVGLRAIFLSHAAGGSSFYVMIFFSLPNITKNISPGTSKKNKAGLRSKLYREIPFRKTFNSYESP